MRFGYAIAAAAALWVQPALAAVTINIQEVGGDVIATTSGSLRRDQQITFQGPSLGASIGPSSGSFLSAAGPMDIIIYSGFYELGDFPFGPYQFGTGSYTQGVGTGDVVMFSEGSRLFGVPQGYISGAPLAAITTFAAQTIGSLGLTPGAYVYHLNGGATSDTITLNIAAPVPEPSAWAMMLLGFGAIGASMRRRKPVSSLLLRAL